MRTYGWFFLPLAFPAIAGASTISIANPTAPPQVVTLSTGGTYDWAHFGADLTATSTFYDYKSGGPNSISNLSPVSSATVTDYNAVGGGYAAMEMSWTNGTTDTSDSANPNLAYDAGNSTGYGLQFNATIPAFTTETLNVYAAGAVSSPGNPTGFGELQASMSGATTVTNTGELFQGASGTDGGNSGVTYGNSAHAFGDFVITVSNTSASPQALNVQFFQTGTPSGGNLELQGVTAFVPEPVSIALLSASAAFLLTRRRRPLSIASDSR